MNSRIKESGPKSATSEHSKCQPTYVVAFSLNENELNMPKEEQLTKNILTDVLLTDIKDSSNDIICGIKSILTEVIDMIDTDKDEIKHGNELNFETSLTELNFNCNSDFSSSNTSTDTITNTSSTRNYTICSENEFKSIENASNTTLKFNHNENKCIDTDFSSKHSICSLEKSQKKDDEKPVNKINLNSVSIMDDISTVNIGKEKNYTEDSISNEASITLDNIVTPYKMEFINVNFLEMVKNLTISPSKEKITVHLSKNNVKDNKDPVNVTKNISNVITDNNKCNSISKICNEHKNSDEALVGSVFSVFCRNDEYLENISINKTDDSTFSLTSRSHYYSSTDEKNENTSETNFNIVPTTSNVDNLISNVIISDGMYKLKSKGDCQFLDLKQKILNKPLDIEGSDKYHKKMNTTLPNGATIKEIITERENLQKFTCSEESRNFQPFCDLWEKISITLDLAIKKLEESLSDKILSELKTTLNKIEHFVNQISLQKLNESRDVNAVERAESFHEEGLQCSIIQSHVIDNLMFKLSGDGQSERSARTKILKVKHPKILADTFEVLKAYSQPVAGITEGDSLKVSSVESGTSTESRRRMLFHGPMRFLRENTIVLGSVPAFFLYMLVIYGFIVLVVKV